MKDLLFDLTATALLFFVLSVVCRYSHYKQIAEKQYQEQDEKFGIERPIKQESKWETLKIILQVFGLIFLFYVLKTGLEVMIYGKPAQ